MVGGEGLEPSRANAHKILSLARLPIPPLAQSILFYHRSSKLSKYGKIKHKMNPQNTPFKPISSAPTDQTTSPFPPVPPADSASSSQAAAANVIRSQIDQILSADQQPNQTITHSSHGQPMITQPTQAQTQAAIPTNNLQQNATVAQNSPEPQTSPTNLNPYAQTHAPTSDTTNLHHDDRVASAAADIAARQAEKAAVQEAHNRYHTAWQQYYQKYYEQYYVAALQEQQTKFAEQQATVADKNQKSGTLTQKEAVQELRNDLRSKIKQAGQKVRKSRHFMPAVAAAVVILIALFVQYNGLVFAQIASFVSPGDTTDQSIIVGTGDNQPVGQDPRIIIPKINVNAPVIYNLPDLSEAASQKALENGPIHYPIAGASAFPGQNGNTVILGHSSADWFEPGNYKFIFVQLNRLVAGDLFYLDYQGVRYTYRVTSSEVISPNQVNTLAIGDDKPYATLITCDPPGTALRRLVVFADQISPDPNKVEKTQSDEQVTVDGNIVGNPPTLFERIFGGK